MNVRVCVPSSTFHAMIQTRALPFKLFQTFPKASFRNAIFRGAYLLNANFVEADVAFADFQDAMITPTELVGAKNVDKATGLTFKMPPP